MNLATARFLTSANAQAALQKLAAQETVSEGNQLAVLTRVRREYSPEEAGALVETLLLRQRAVSLSKFSRAEAMFFTRAGLEQASGEAVAAYRARRMVQALVEGARVADLACGIGGDLLALATSFEVTGVDLDAARLELAKANLAAYGRTGRLVALDLQQFDPTGYQALFFDPGRRTSEGKRIFDVADYQPPLSIIKKWLPVVSEIAVKLSPGVDYAQLTDYDCEIEIISENGAVKEAVLWFGKLRSGAIRRATLLPQEITLTDQPNLAPVASGVPLAYLYEPDGAVIRAGLVEELAVQMGGTTRKLDPDIAYLTSDQLIETPLARVWRVLEYQPWSLKKLNKRLQELDVGKVIIKKRGSPVDPQTLERALKLKGTRQLTVFLTHIMGQPSVVLCKQ